MNSKMKGLFALTMAAACATDCNVYSMGKESRMERGIKPMYRGSKPVYGDWFSYEDGFECYALNQKNADRKHNNWLKSKKFK